VSSPEDLAGDVAKAHPDLRIGLPEREAAREALDVHLAADRLHPREHEQRLTACHEARTQAELLRVFADLPAPHPELPGTERSSVQTDEDLSSLGAAVLVTLLLGLPVAVVLGIVYGTWWALAIPVAVSVLLFLLDHLFAGKTESAP
jgi:hypothetical protein